MRRIDDAERRARLGLHHHLATEAGAGDVVEVARGLVALHGTDPASVYLAAAARLKAPDTASMERALYDDRSLVRMLGMRRTVFVVTTELAPIVQGACTQEIAVRERRRLLQQLDQAGIAEDPAAWLHEVEESVLRALAVRGEATAGELAEDEPRLRAHFMVGEGKKWGGPQAVSTRVLFLLAASGRIIRGRPRGSWISTQFRWAPMGAWLSDGLPEVPADAARVELARRWLRAFGPATAADLKWWTGWTAGQVKRTLGAIEHAEVDLAGRTGLLLADDLAPPPTPEPWAALLPALDPTVMGWADRQWFLGEHRSALFDRSGNAGPTVWWDGRVIGGWAQRKDGEVVYRLLEDAGVQASAAVEQEALRLRAWLGDTRVTPRFRTPLERELSA